MPADCQHPSARPGAIKPEPRSWGARPPRALLAAPRGQHLARDTKLNARNISVRSLSGSDFGLKVGGGSGDYVDCARSLPRRSTTKTGATAAKALWVAAKSRDGRMSSLLAKPKRCRASLATAVQDATRHSPASGITRFQSHPARPASLKRPLQTTRHVPA